MSSSPRLFNQWKVVGGHKADNSFKGLENVMDQLFDFSETDKP